MPTRLAVKRFAKNHNKYLLNRRIANMLCIVNTIGSRIKDVRKRMGLSQEKLAERLNVSRQLVSMWEIDRSMPDALVISNLAEMAGVSVDYLLGRTSNASQSSYLPKDVETHPVGPRIELPVYEEASAGMGCYVSEAPAEFAPVDARRVAHDVENFYYVRVKGDSMAGAGIVRGSLALVHKQDSVESGQIALVVLPDGTSCIKIVRYSDDRVLLIARNPAYGEAEFRRDEIRICGRVVSSTVNFD
jgi:repressor LexA